MGQYWKPVNLDKRETFSPHRLGDGMKLTEQAGSACGVAGALVLLLAPLPEKRGGGDPFVGEHDPFIGRWAGDRIVMVGDYSIDSDLPGVDDFCALYSSELTDISLFVADGMNREFSTSRTEAEV